MKTNKFVLALFIGAISAYDYENATLVGLN